MDAEELRLEERNVAIARSMASLHREKRSSAAVPPLASVYSLSTAEDSARVSYRFGVFNRKIRYLGGSQACIGNRGVHSPACTALPGLSRCAEERAERRDEHDVHKLQALLRTTIHAQRFGTVRDTRGSRPESRNMCEMREMSTPALRLSPPLVVE